MQFIPIITCELCIAQIICSPNPPNIHIIVAIIAKMLSPVPCRRAASLLRSAAELVWAYTNGRVEVDAVSPWTALAVTAGADASVAVAATPAALHGWVFNAPLPSYTGASGLMHTTVGNPC